VYAVAIEMADCPKCHKHYVYNGKKYNDHMNACNGLQTKKKISKSLRQLVWNTYMGDVKTGKCYCCGVKLDYMDPWEDGHIVSEANGGTTDLANLRPVCGKCNKNMSTMHMHEYMRKHGYVIVDIAFPHLAITDAARDQFEETFTELCMCVEKFNDNWPRFIAKFFTWDVVTVDSIVNGTLPKLRESPTQWIYDTKRKLSTAIVGGPYRQAQIVIAIANASNVSVLKKVLMKQFKLENVHTEDELFRCLDNPEYIDGQYSRLRTWITDDSA